MSLTLKQAAEIRAGAGFIVVAAIVLLWSLMLFGCATTETRGPTLAEIRDTACPVAMGVVLGLQVTPEVAPEIKEQLKAVEPVINAACAATSNLADLKAMSDAAFPVILKLVADSDMKPDQKQMVVIGVTTARLLIVNYHAYQVPATVVPKSLI